MSALQFWSVFHQHIRMTRVVCSRASITERQPAVDTRVADAVVAAALPTMCAKHNCACVAMRCEAIFAPAIFPLSCCQYRIMIVHHYPILTAHKNPILTAHRTAELEQMSHGTHTLTESNQRCCYRMTPFSQHMTTQGIAHDVICFSKCRIR